MNEDRLKEILKQSVSRTRPVTTDVRNANHVKITTNTPEMQRTDNIYKRRG